MFWTNTKINVILMITCAIGTSMFIPGVIFMSKNNGDEYIGTNTYRFTYSDANGQHITTLTVEDPLFMKLYAKGNRPSLISKSGNNYCLYPNNLSYDTILSWGDQKPKFYLDTFHQILMVYNNTFVTSCGSSQAPIWSILMTFIGGMIIGISIIFLAHINQT